MDPRLAAALAPGERIVWSDQPHFGVLPRTPLGLTLGGVLVSVVGIGLGAAWPALPGPARGALGVALVGVLAAALWGALRPRPRYALTDRGRGLIARGEGVLSFPLAGEAWVGRGREVGDLCFGAREITLPDGGREEREVTFEAVGYPHELLGTIRALQHGP